MPGHPGGVACCSDLTTTKAADARLPVSGQLSPHSLAGAARPGAPSQRSSCG